LSPAPRRTAVPKRVREAVYARQDGRCALCREQHPLHIHHITPVAIGGSNELDNLILLCANHHALADLDVLPTGLLKRYRDGGLESPVIGIEATALYELRSSQITQCLFGGFDEASFESAERLVTQLQKVHSGRYRMICLELLDAMLASLALHDPRAASPRAKRIRHRFDTLRKEFDSEEAAFLAARVEHHTGLLLHARRDYVSALERYDVAKKLLSGLDKREQVLGEMRVLQVHTSSALHLSSDRDSDRARDLANSVTADGSNDYASAFAGIKLAEHEAVRDDIAAASARLQALLRDARVLERPLLKVMVLKGLADLHLRAELTSEAFACTLAALMVCQEHGLADQAQQLHDRVGSIADEAASVIGLALEPAAGVPRESAD
jgi:hypothetical protein